MNRSMGCVGLRKVSGHLRWWVLIFGSATIFKFGFKNDVGAVLQAASTHGRQDMYTACSGKRKDLRKLARYISDFIVNYTIQYTTCTGKYTIISRQA